MIAPPKARALHLAARRPPWTRAPPQDRRRRLAGRRRRTTTSDANAVAAPASSGAANGHQRKTAAVFGFFGASDRELKLIEKRYAKNGYECVVVPSPVKEVARPSGWYKNFRRNARLGKDHELARHFDVVHCMSGGFLNYYLTPGAGHAAGGDTLLLDSTPILPKPRAFTTFARQFMRDALPFGKVVDLFPQPLHCSLDSGGVRGRPSATGPALGPAAAGAAPARVAGPHDALAARVVVGGAPGQLRPIVAAAARRVGRAPRGAAAERAVFLHNPADPTCRATTSSRRWRRRGAADLAATSTKVATNRGPSRSRLRRARVRLPAREAV